MNMSATESMPPSPIAKVVEQPFVAPPRFMKVRTIVFGSVFALSFIWIILLCVVIFSEWSVMDIVERYLIVIILLVQFITVILVPLLLAGEFRPWLDAARSLCLFASHFGVAVWFIAKATSFKCSSQGANQMALCNFIIIFLLTANWIIPTLILGYSSGLAYLIRRMSKMPPPSPSSKLDIEKQTLEKSVADISFPPSIYRISRMPQTPTTPLSMATSDRQRRQSTPYSIHSNAQRMSRAPLSTPIHDRMHRQSAVQHRSMYRASAVSYPTTPTTPQTPDIYGGIQSGPPRASTLPPLNVASNPRQVPRGMYYTTPMPLSTPSQIYTPYYGPPPNMPSQQSRQSYQPSRQTAVTITPQTPKSSVQQQQRQQKTSSQQSSVYSQASYGYAT
ncbi:hypothetical protein CPB83DRAFT_847595 [Crepidotus variabilis]|uniref:Uncharacterized protein n=1 Tax=Crepidotus variabilis TaxID=179855 RepID=A0A9P6ENA8_9AGAR|nr:hypothetical protein CPB83DRAFT_847595 [Crepidotus variabilis]